jgi:hypothetical protein
MTRPALPTAGHLQKKFSKRQNKMQSEGVAKNDIQSARLDGIKQPRPVLGDISPKHVSDSPRVIVIVVETASNVGDGESSGESTRQPKGVGRDVGKLNIIDIEAEAVDKTAAKEQISTVLK